MSKTSDRRGSSGTTKPTKSRDARRPLVEQSAHRRAKSQSVKKHISKARLEEVTAELDSQVTHVQTLYTTQVKGKETPASNENDAVEGLGDILRAL